MKSNLLALAAAIAGVALISPAAHAATIGTATVTNANHYGYFGFASTSAQNTKATVGPFPFGGGIARVIHVTGTITPVSALAYADGIQVQPKGTGVAGYQPSWQFTDQVRFNGPLTVNTNIYAPGGFDATKALNLEMFALDDEQFVPGLDARSTLTYTFDSAFAPGSVEFGGTLATTDPTFARPTQYEVIDGDDNAYWDAPEDSGSTPHYDVQPFHVATVGEYTLVSANEFESAMVLYEGAFDPAHALDDVLAAREQGTNVLRSKALNDLPYLDDAVGASNLSAVLQPGVQYYMVTTAYSAPGGVDDGGPFVGRYNNLITGAGNVTLGVVPEPATLAVVFASSLTLLRSRKR